MINLLPDRRAITAVIAGFSAATALVVGTHALLVGPLGLHWAETDPVLLALYLAASMFGGALGGIVASSLARRRVLHTGAALATVVFLLGLTGVAAGPTEGQPDWYPWALLLLTTAGVVIGSGCTHALRRESVSSQSTSIEGDR